MKKHISANYKAVHKNRSSLLYRKGKERLRSQTLKQLHQRLESAQTGKLKDAIRCEIARKTRLGIFWQRPEEPGSEV